MPIIPLMAYNVFTVMDETYWTGYPTRGDDPYTDPVPNWANSRYMMVRLKPTQQARLHERPEVGGSLQPPRAGLRPRA